MATWTCADCTTPYAVGMEQCPYCGSTEYEETDSMPKIGKFTGPTIEGDPAMQPPPIEETDESESEGEGGESQSVGSSSETSSESSVPSEGPQSPENQSPALETVNPSVEQGTELSTADSADTGPGSAPRSGLRGRRRAE